MGFDAIIIGSGFGGAISGCRLAQAGMKVLVLERGRRWDNKPGPGVTPYPRELDDPWVWDQEQPELLNGWLDLRVFRGMAVAQGAAVGGGSLIYASISVEAPEAVFKKGWPQELSKAELQPYYDQVARFMDVKPLPVNQWNPRIRLMQEGAEKIGEKGRFKQLPIAVNFRADLTLDPANPPSAADTIYGPNQHGAVQGTCIHAGQCDIGCPVKAKNTLDVNYIAVAEKNGAEVRPLHFVRNIEKAGAGYRVHFDQLKDGQRVSGTEDARIVIVASGSLGSTELLFRCREMFKTLPNISRRLGMNWSSNGDFLVPAFYEHRELFPEIGPTISSAIDFLDRIRGGQSFWIEDGGMPPVFRHHMRAVQAGGGKHHPFEGLIGWLQQELQTADPFDRIMPWFAQGVDAGDAELTMQRPWFFFGEKRFDLKWDITHSLPLFKATLGAHEELSSKTGGLPLVSPFWKTELVTPHPLGGCNIGNTAQDGVVDHTGQVFGCEDLYVIDGSMVPTPLGVNPSRTIAALAERCAKMIVQKRPVARAGAH
ncbi:MAG TPA: GMC family oxidoreductase [Verrucomicrobiae bacterium]|nr:GMC family oxidoreductase [Verrucomicrobiae bacterium]